MVDDERAREGLEHLQAAAKELIAAVRAMLDVAEDLVDDPSVVQDVAGLFGAAARSAVRGAGFPRSGDAGEPGDQSGDQSGVERITLS